VSGVARPPSHSPSTNLGQFPHGGSLYSVTPRTNLTHIEGAVRHRSSSLRDVRRCFRQRGLDGECRELSAGARALPRRPATLDEPGLAGAALLHFAVQFPLATERDTLALGAFNAFFTALAD
jgi:hypothetical protein